ncbi:MAG: PAS domain S-box protein [Actinobacteria bacterium]|nr:MAG: PAS domain S-box protein [Actinomycetota bacterium]
MDPPGPSARTERARTGELDEVYEATFRDHPSSICILRMRDLTFVAANPAFERASGRSVPDLVGRRPDEIGLIDPADAAIVHREVAALEEGDPSDFVTRIRYRLPDGREAFARMAVGLTELHGERHVIASFTDASAAVRQELALGRRDAILQTIGAAAQLFLQADRWEDAIHEVLRRLGEGAAVSRAHVFENVTLPGGELGSTHRFEWCAPGVEPQIGNPNTIDQAFDPSQDRWRATLGRGEPWSVNVVALPPATRDEFAAQGIVSLLDMPIFAGKEWWGSIGFDDCEHEREWTSAEIDALRIAAGTLGAAIRRQQTERSLRETEELYRTLVEQIPAVVYVNVIGEDYVPLYTSPGIEQMLGITPDDFMTRRMWFELVHPDDRERVNAEDERTERTLEPFSIEYRMLRADARVVWVLDQAEVVRDENGDPRFWSGVMFDITSLKQAEEDLARALEIEREASARLRSLDELKNTFLQAVSHDLRTPLTSLLGSALTLEREDVELGPEVQRDLVRRIAGNARKLLRLVTDLLDLDRLSQGLLEPQRAMVDLAEVVRNVVAESDAVADRDVSVDATTTTVAIDVPKVERIVENLLVNAARHTPPDAHIWVRVQPGNGGAILAVEDDGPGLLPEDRDRVFGAFERGVNAATHAPGSGIGLTLVARFAELHGGRAWAEEREGGGASFLVWLPSGAGAPPQQALFAPG